MEFIYLTAKKYPSRTADHFFVKEMALALGEILKEKFSLVLANDRSDFFKGIKVINLGLSMEKGRTFYYFFWLLLFAIKNRSKKAELIFFSNDPNLLCNLAILKKIFSFSYRICSEWHMLLDDWRDAFIVRNSDFVVATSNRLMKFIAGRVPGGLDSEKFLVVYGGVDTEKYPMRDIRELRRELGLPQDKKLVAYVGLFKTLGVKKGIDVMINALATLPKEIEMLFVGGTKEEIREYELSISDKELLRRCIFIERQDPERVPMYQMAADILVIPNPDTHPFNDYCIPMKVYEYMANRKPIVYSKLSLLDEVLQDCAFNFVPENSENLAEKVLHVVHSDPKAIQQKGDACREKAEQWSWKARARKIIDFLGFREYYC